MPPHLRPGLQGSVQGLPSSRSPTTASLPTLAASASFASSSSDSPDSCSSLCTPCIVSSHSSPWSTHAFRLQRLMTKATRRSMAASVTPPTVTTKPFAAATSDGWYSLGSTTGNSPPSTLTDMFVASLQPEAVLGQVVLDQGTQRCQDRRSQHLGKRCRIHACRNGKGELHRQGERRRCCGHPAHDQRTRGVRCLHGQPAAGHLDRYLDSGGLDARYAGEGGDAAGMHGGRDVRGGRGRHFLGELQPQGAGDPAEGC
mmetsp:Transcript_61373/g.198555  ORF Transcript_61373/g.198555 Transcript_61373/m.198555 type:complete len:257 (+) Transcript_61373:530-1300(+)